MSKKNNSFSWKDSVSLKDYIEEKISNLEEKMDLKFIANERAGLIDSKEIARRLEILNGEAERLRQMQATYLPREVYESNLQKLVDDIDENKEFRNISLGKQSIIAVVTSVAISLAFFILSRVL